MPISDIVKRRLGTNPRRRFLLWHQSGHFTAKPPAKKQVFVQYPIGGGGECFAKDFSLFFRLIRKSIKH